MNHWFYLLNGQSSDFSIGPLAHWSHASVAMSVLKTAVSATPILGPVVSGWSCFHDQDCIENNSKCLALDR